MKSSLKTSLAFALFLVWLLITLAVFIVISRATYVQLFLFQGFSGFSEYLQRIDYLKYIWDIFLAGAGAFLFSLACFSLGMRILYRLKDLQPSILALWMTAFLTGEILYSVIFLAVIKIYGLSPLFVVAALLIGFLAGLPYLKISPPWASPSFLNGFIGTEKLIFGLVILTLASGLLLSSARLGYDATAEYFSHSKIMAASQAARYFYPKNTIVVSAFHPGILFTAVIQLFGDQSARMLSWFNGLAVLILGLTIGEKAGLSRRALLYFLVLMITSTAFTDLLGDGKVELISTAPILAAVYWVLHNKATLSAKVFLLIGCMAGFSIISRPYNIFLVSVFVILFYLSELIQKLRENQNNIGAGFRAILPVFWLLPPIILLGVFHLWQNWLWLGSVFAPLTYARQTDASIWAWQFDPTKLNMLRLLYPFTVTFFNTPQSLGNISPFFVGFLPFLTLPETRKHLFPSRDLQGLVRCAFVTLILWITLFFTVVEIRYVVFLWTIFFLWASVLIDNSMGLLKGPFHTVVHVLMAGLLACLASRTWIISIGSYSPIDQTGNPHCYNLNLCTFFVPVNEEAAQGDRVLVLQAYRYYLRSDLFACSSLAEEYPPLEALARRDSPDFWVEVYRQGFQYVVFEEHLSEFRYMFGALPSVTSKPDWLFIERVSISTDTSEVAYRLRVVNPPVRPEKICQKGKSGAWIVMPVSK